MLEIILLKNNQKSLITFLFVFIALAYFYPVIKNAKNKLDCESIAKNYIVTSKNTTGINNKKITNLNKKELKMLSVNFCSGGEEIYEIEN